MIYEIDIQNRDFALKPGMFATVSFILKEHKNAITIPKDALLKDADENFVFTVVNGKAKRTDVTPGISENNTVGITNGLTVSDNIITTGQEFTRDGVVLNVQNKKD